MPAVLEYERPWLAPYQLEALFCPERYALVEASTKAGKTAGCMVWLTELAMLHGRPGNAYWWVAPILAQSRMVFERLRRVLPRQVYELNESVPFLQLRNGARLVFKGADDPDSLYGEDVYGAVIDEASRTKEQSWHAVRTTLTATKGPVRIIGNVKGRKNWFYRLARIAQRGGDPTMHYAKITSADAIRAGLLEAAEVEDARQKLPAAVYRELYEAEPSDDQGNPFGLDAIRAITVPALSSGVPVIWGWDLAKSIDFTVGIALDEQGRVCRFVRFQKPWRESIKTIQRETGDAPAVVDASGVGDPIVETLQRSSRVVKDPDTGVESLEPAFAQFEAFKFTAASKQSLMEGLAVAIQQQRIRVPAGPIPTELEAFEYVYDRTGVRYSAPAGMHDDCVIALALANSRFNAVDRHTGDDWMRLFRAGEKKRVGKDPDVGEDEYVDPDEDDAEPTFGRTRF